MLRDLQSVVGYSWGSAVLAYLYRKMCDSTHKVITNFAGYATLVQVWIYERFPTLAPRHTATPLIIYPLALRWTGPFTRTEVPHGQRRITRYELDNMIEANFRWRPYADLDDEHQPEYDLYLRWTAPTPLMYMAYVEWCYTDRVTRQFGFVQDIPTSSPRANHSNLHTIVNEAINWEGARESHTRIWDRSLERALTSPPLMFGEGCTAAYMPWFLAVTRRYIVNPVYWRTAEAFQGTQGATQALEDQLLDMESAIDPATLDLARAQRIVQGLLGRFRGSRNPSRHRGRPPVTPVEPEPGTYYTHVASGSSDTGGWSHLVGTSSSPVGDVAGTSRADGWDSWPASTVGPSTYAGDDYEGGPRGFTVRLEDDQDMSAERQSQESYQFQDADAYRPDMSFLRDQYTTPPPQVPVPSFASQSYIFGAPAFPFAPPPERSTPTPIQMSTFASYTGESSPWAPPSTAVPGHSEAEEQPEDEHRQQPPRAAKGKGRRCHTGSHIFGHKKK
nr:PREDICTED: uncharacterized protein LOC108196534 [Daucus carota subsp. sativus]